MAKKKAAVKRKPAAKKRAPAKKKATARKKSGLMTMTYSTSPELQAIVGTGKMTRPMIVKKMWVYIKAKKLQDPKQRRMIVPDAKLSAVLGKKPVDMLKMASLMSKHIKK
jgi:chromatin remodeling complex protein RSC6